MIELDQLIERLKEELGPVADFMTDAVVKQLWVGGVYNVLWIVLTGTVLWLTATKFVPWVLEDAPHFPNDREMVAIPTGVLVVVPAIIGLIANVAGLIQRVVNPEWVAIQLLKNLVG